MNMEIRRGDIIVKTIDEGQNSIDYPATVEIIDAPTGKTLCKLKARSREGAAGAEWVHRIEFEEMTSRPQNFPFDEGFRQDMVEK